MRKKLVCSILVFAMSLTMVIGLPAIAYGGQSGNVNITLPNFKVTMNGAVVNNDYSKYPLIVYNDVTYFPMTYSDCRYLGIESVWKGDKDGLIVDATGITAAYNPYKSASKNGKYYTAKIPSFPIKVNGKTIDNSKEQYPLLSFRDITYFPMTWKYGVEQFGWDYSFDGKKGLVIKSKNPLLHQIAISKERPKKKDYSKDTGKLSNSVTVADGYIYYEGTKGRIMQSPLSDSLKTKCVYQLNKADYGSRDYVTPYLDNEGGKAELRFHVGGPTMGSDYEIQLNSDGTTTEFNNSRTIKKVFEDKTFECYVGPAPGPGNLTMVKGKDKEINIGSSDYLYGWAWHGNDDGSQGGSGQDSIFLIGDDLYILAYDMKSAEDNYKNTGSYKQTTGIHKVNINTNQVKRISEKEVLDFKKEGEYLYYASGDSVYRYSTTNGKEELLKKLVKGEDYIRNIEVLNGNVYWQDGLNRNLYKLDGTNVNLGGLLDSTDTTNRNGMALAGSKKEYLVCSFEETDNCKYRLMIFDKNGEVVFKTSDKAYPNSVFIEKNNLYFYNISTSIVCNCQINKQ